jgi:hypothetical protein
VTNLLTIILALCIGSISNAISGFVSRNLDESYARSIKGVIIWSAAMLCIFGGCLFALAVAADLFGIDSQSPVLAVFYCVGYGVMFRVRQWFGHGESRPS